MDVDTDDVWSDTSQEEEEELALPIQSRAYQIEMFEHSMKGNIIAVMGTGSGKTQVAKLRIEVELQRSPNKKVWFTAPSVVLAYQQYSFLSQQLPAFQFRLITGMDNAEFWDTQEVWDKALYNVHAVVCTPAILLQALNAGFVTMRTISLLVVDEAHHCVGKSASRTTMQLHYHSLKSSSATHELPCIMGLSASPITKKDKAEIRQLEVNLDAQCKFPVQQLEEYTAFVNLPQLETLTFGEQLLPPPTILTRLSQIVSNIQVADDPITKLLRESADYKAREKLEKILRKNATPAMMELQGLLRSATTIHRDLGSWACGAYITTCVRKLHAAVSHDTGLQLHAKPPHDNRRFMDSSLQPLHGLLGPGHDHVPARENHSEKVQVLLDFLGREYRDSLRGLIFVQARHTAWALTAVINNDPAMQNYRAFSFVGVSNAAYQGTFDFAQLHAQNENLERFRRGELNLCIATAVLEEGIDVPAMNLVICFDERPNFRSFVQSRGRARQANSKFVLFRSQLEAPSKMKKWHDLELDMKEESESSIQQLEQRQRLEWIEEPDGTVFRVPSTGATLTFDNARQLLQRFCAKLPKKGDSERTDLAFCIDGEIGVELSAKVYLPTCLPANLQVACSKSSWRTEKMAKRDAAFQAYLGLYEAGLVTDNLQPLQLRDESNGEEQHDSIYGQGTEKRESTYAVSQQNDPWPQVMESWASSHAVYAHRLQVKDGDGFMPALNLLLPAKLSDTAFPLYPSHSDRVQVSLGPGKEVPGDYPVDLAREISLHLLATVLGRRLHGFRKDQFPFLLVPDLEPQMLQSWYESVSVSRLLTDFRTISAGQEYLVLPSQEQIPYVYQLQAGDFRAGAICNGTDFDREDLEITATRLSRRLDFLSPAATPAPAQPRCLAVSGCALLGLPVAYARLILLVPSITHMLELSLRSTAACHGPLAGLGFRDIDLVAEALTLPRVGSRNYQRLEFLGDDLLKFYASIQVFVDGPNLPESLLTIARGRIVSNARLQRATRTVGLDPFLTQHRFAGTKWTAGVSRESHPDESSTNTKTHLSSKVLADVVEALIGAASLDAAIESIPGPEAEEKVIRALQLFIDEVPWRPLSENVARVSIMEDDSVVDGGRRESLDRVESLIGYTFQHGALLAEALTQSWVGGGGGVSSYERLEFLGDAVLDHIVKTRLFRSSLQLDPEQMTLRRHALVSHATLAFFACQTSYTCRALELTTDPLTRETVDRESTRTVYLFDHVRRVGSREDAVSRDATLAAYSDVRSAIVHAFTQGRKFPWMELLHLGAPKMYSDVVESILGAVFIDSRGDLGACTRVLQTMGFMDLVDRFTVVPEQDLDLRHPEQTLSLVLPGCELMARQTKRSRAGAGAGAGAAWWCKVMLDGERIAHAKNASCKDEAQCRAAARAVDILSNRPKTEPGNGDQGLKTYGSKKRDHGVMAA
ncbi:hypothetical protein A1O3_10169 [Capronia epimyces CBS 606.96]|uniref:Dicer-like protein 2 n=1 Tax=Capronia epimyces CBS 606.96 TaxID=1182542 RepID=W9X967_9EURO|nr:uncharacterized protein A1O3_10169 [Capronia epimyces CBS 606.96]EXJ77012.1 hypothetical protein A1O3_10169 [Capronia epimyces CBS 606.96]